MYAQVLVETVHVPFDRAITTSVPGIPRLLFDALKRDPVAGMVGQLQVDHANRHCHTERLQYRFQCSSFVVLTHSVRGCTICGLGRAAHPIIRIWTLNRPRLHWSICDQSPERDFLILIFVPHQLHGQHVPGRNNDFYCPQVHDPVEQQPTANGPQPMASTGILHVIIQGRAYSLWIIQLHK